MSFADVAEEVLKRASGGPLSYEEITHRAIEDGLVSTRSDQPWVYMAPIINADNRARISRGDRPRFTSAQRGQVQLSAPASASEHAVEAWNAESKGKLLNRLYETDPYQFENIVGALLARTGFQVKVTQRSKDGGIDVRGTLNVNGVTQVETAIQVKRWRKKVGTEEVSKLRGALAPKEQGLIVPLSDFTADALREAASDRLAPFTLVNRQRLIELMAEYELGLRKRSLTALEIMEGSFLESAVRDEDDDADERSEGTIAALADETETATRSPINKRIRRVLAPLPGTPANYTKSLLVLLDYIAGQPTFDEFIDFFQKSFPEITRRPEAKRWARVALSLGFARIIGDRISLTPKGNAFLTSEDPGVVTKAILDRIHGAQESWRCRRREARIRRNSVRNYACKRLPRPNKKISASGLTQLGTEP